MLQDWRRQGEDLAGWMEGGRGQGLEVGPISAFKGTEGRTEVVRGGDGKGEVSEVLATLGTSQISPVKSQFNNDLRRGVSVD